MIGEEDMMKRFFRIFIFVFMALMLSACGDKKALTSSEITAKLSNNGFSITDVTSQMEDKSISYVASANNGRFQIEYYVFASEEDAKKAYKNNKESFESNKTKGKEKTGESYEKYTQKLSDTYNLITRVDNTLLYSSVNIEYKGDLNKVIKDLGY